MTSGEMPQATVVQMTDPNMQEWVWIDRIDERALESGPSEVYWRAVCEACGPVFSGQQLPGVLAVAYEHLKLQTHPEIPASFEGATRS